MFRVFFAFLIAEAMIVNIATGNEVTNVQVSESAFNQLLERVEELEASLSKDQQSVRLAYDSGWKTYSPGQQRTFVINPPINPDRTVVILTARNEPGEHNIDHLIINDNGAWMAGRWVEYDGSEITVERLNGDGLYNWCPEMRLRIFQY